MKIMMLHEAQERLKKNTIVEKQLRGLNSLYILLDIDKDDFEKKEKYLKSISRLEELEFEKQDLERIVNGYKHLM